MLLREAILDPLMKMSVKILIAWCYLNLLLTYISLCNCKDTTQMDKHQGLLTPFCCVIITCKKPNIYSNYLFYRKLLLLRVNYYYYGKLLLIFYMFWIRVFDRDTWWGPREDHTYRRVVWGFETGTVPQEGQRNPTTQSMDRNLEHIHYIKIYFTVTSSLTNSSICLHYFFHFMFMEIEILTLL